MHENDLNDVPDWLGGGHLCVREYVSCCDSCGWWRIHTYKETDGDIEGISTIIKNAVLRKYDLSGKDIPINVLQQYLRNNYEDVINIHDQQMEKLVQSVFSEHFSCEVEHIGKSHDGGIDLLLVRSDNPTVIQVKRRKKLSHIESVSGIRELLGAALLKESKNCIYVSTCSNFSKPANTAAARALELGIVESYELYDFSRFSDVLKLTARSNVEPWRQFLEI
ncbi:restriction endonuclease [Marinobacterium aestuariivivens]|uniref:Restriction endonuclease n=1 Tax=Marinobacterium aestuariivivens TaxID=1698799 RepID=A0ABW2A491_9GAMM